MTVSPVFAEDSQEFKSCQQMKWKGNKKAKKNCFRDVASGLEFTQQDTEQFKSCQQMKWKGNKKAKKNCFRDLARAFNASNKVRQQKKADDIVKNEGRLKQSVYADQQLCTARWEGMARYCGAYCCELKGVKNLEVKGSSIQVLKDDIQKMARHDLCNALLSYPMVGDAFKEAVTRELC
jgi:hypothetical protein